MSSMSRGAFAAGQGAARVLALAAEVQAEHGVVEPLEVLGEALALELEDGVLEVLARPARLVDQDHHRRGGAELRAIVRGGQRGAVERMELEVEMIGAGHERPGGDGLAQRVGRIGLGLLLGQGHAALVADLAPRLPRRPLRLLRLHHRQADHDQRQRQRPARLRRPCPASVSHRDPPPDPASALAIRPGPGYPVPALFIVKSIVATDKRRAVEMPSRAPQETGNTAGRSWPLT